MTCANQHFSIHEVAKDSGSAVGRQATRRLQFARAARQSHERTAVIKYFAQARQCRARRPSTQKKALRNSAAHWMACFCMCVLVRLRRLGEKERGTNNQFARRPWRASGTTRGQQSCPLANGAALRVGTLKGGWYNTPSRAEAGCAAIAEPLVGSPRTSTSTRRPLARQAGAKGPTVRSNWLTTALLGWWSTALPRHRRHGPRWYCSRCACQ